MLMHIDEFTLPALYLQHRLPLTNSCKSADESEHDCTLMRLYTVHRSYRLRVEVVLLLQE